MAEDTPEQDDVPTLDEIMSTTGWDNRVALARARRARVLAERSAAAAPPRNPFKEEEPPTVAAAATAAAASPPPPDNRLVLPELAPEEDLPEPEADDERQRPVALFWAAGIFLAVLLGGYIAWQQISGTLSATDITTAPVEAPALDPSPLTTPLTEPVGLGLPTTTRSEPFAPPTFLPPDHSRQTPQLAEATGLPAAPVLLDQFVAALESRIEPVALPAGWPVFATHRAPALPDFLVASAADSLPATVRRAEVSALSDFASPASPVFGDRAPQSPAQIDEVEVARAQTASLGLFDANPVSVPLQGSPARIDAQRTLASLDFSPSSIAPVAPAQLGATPRIASAPAITPVDVAPAALPATSGPAAPQLDLPGTGLEVRILSPRTASNAAVTEARAEIERFGSDDGGTQEIDFTVRQKHLRFYHNSDRSTANALARALGVEARDMTSVSSGPDPGNVEYWLSGRTSQPAPAPARTRARAAPPPPQPTGTCVRRSGRTGETISVPIINGRCQWQ